VSGLVRPAQGTVVLGGRDITRGRASLAAAVDQALTVFRR
jgi:hypothetical protein